MCVCVCLCKSTCLGMCAFHLPVFFPPRPWPKITLMFPFAFPLNPKYNHHLPIMHLVTPPKLEKPNQASSDHRQLLLPGLACISLHTRLDTSFVCYCKNTPRPVRPGPNQISAQRCGPGSSQSESTGPPARPKHHLSSPDGISFGE